VSSSHFLTSSAKDDKGHALVELSPVPEELIKERQPIITARLARLGTVIPETVRLRVAGLGTVPARYDPTTMTVTYQLPYKLRREDCAVTLNFKRAADQPDEVVGWRFKIDLAAAYVPLKLP
jgi:hypothetical protein